MDKEKTEPKNPRVLWWLAVVLAAAIGVSIWSKVAPHKANGNTNAPTNVNVAQNVNQAPANTNSATANYTYPGQDGQTALALLKTAYPNTVTKTSSIGEYVTAINGQAASGNQGWIFKVNGAEPAVGADKYVTKSSDTIEWDLASF